MEEWGHGEVTTVVIEEAIEVKGDGDGNGSDGSHCNGVGSR